jgi:polyhydroxyalkanoate synthase subunit PhaC
MYTPFDVRPDQLAEEAAKVQQKLGAGLATLRDMGDVHYGVTAKEEVWRDGKVVLYRFKGERAPTARIPLLICYALVNRPYMVDLQDDRSLVKNLLALGEDVYLIDWGYTDRSDRFLTLEDYIERFLGGAVDHLRHTHRLDAINLLGICQGGAFSLSYSALHPDRIKNLITMVTPVDFHTDDNMLSNWTRGLDIDLFVDTLGNVPADMMNLCYLMLKPYRLFVQKYVGMVDILDDRKAMEDFLRFAQSGRRSLPAVHQAVLSGQRFRERRYRDRRTRGGSGVRRHAGAEYLRRTGPPGAAVGFQTHEGPGRQHRLF